MSLNSNELLSAMQTNSDPETARLARVTRVFLDSDGIYKVNVQFYGESEASSLDIPIMQTGTPSVGEIAVVQKVGTSQIVIGKLKAK